MTKAEAAAILGVQEDLALSEFGKKYESLHSDYQVRLTNAPTPALKKMYQEKLQELERAAETLHPGFSTSAGGGDLPAFEPVIDPSGGSRPRQSPPPAPRPSPRTDTGGQSTDTDASTAGLPRSTMIAGFVTVLLAAALSFVGLRWIQTGGELTQLRGDYEKVMKAATAYQARAEAADRLLFADRLRVRNLSEGTVKLSAVAFVYRDQSNALKVAHSGNYNYPTWEIRPGAIAQLDPEMGRGRLWDGPVIYYSFLVEAPNVEPFLKTGVWVEDIDRLDKVVTIDLD